MTQQFIWKIAISFEELTPIRKIGWKSKAITNDEIPVSFMSPSCDYFIGNEQKWKDWWLNGAYRNSKFPINSKLRFYRYRSVINEDTCQDFKLFTDLCSKIIALQTDQPIVEHFKIVTSRQWKNLSNVSHKSRFTTSAKFQPSNVLLLSRGKYLMK